MTLKAFVKSIGLLLSGLGVPIGNCNSKEYSLLSIVLLNI